MSAVDPLTFPGAAIGGYAYYWDGDKYNNSINTAYGETYAQGDIIGIAVDLDTGKIWFSKNGVYQASGDPVAGTGEAYSGLSGTLYPGTGLYRLNNASTIRGLSTDVTYAPPTGFNVWNDTKVETPVILPTSGAYQASQSISMSCTTSGADIYYTDDGSTPDATDMLYSAPFTLDSAKTIKAIGIKSGLTDSDIVAEIYTIAVIESQPIITILT